MLGVEEVLPPRVQGTHASFGCIGAGKVGVIVKASKKRPVKKRKRPSKGTKKVRKVRSPSVLEEGTKGEVPSIFEDKELLAEALRLTGTRGVSRQHEINAIYAFLA